MAGLPWHYAPHTAAHDGPRTVLRDVMRKAGSKLAEGLLLLGLAQKVLAHLQGGLDLPAAIGMTNWYGSGGAQGPCAQKALMGWPITLSRA